jgi:hypothetical protein
MGTILTFGLIIVIFIIIRTFSMFVTRRVRRNRGMGPGEGWSGDSSTFGPSGGGHHGHHGGWGGGDGGGHHGGGGGGGDGGGGGHHG